MLGKVWGKCVTVWGRCGKVLMEVWESVLGCGAGRGRCGGVETCW